MEIIYLGSCRENVSLDVKYFDECYHEPEVTKLSNDDMFKTLLKLDKKKLRNLENYNSQNLCKF